jgi:hypothetical protein
MSQYTSLGQQQDDPEEYKSGSTFKDPISGEKYIIHSVIDDKITDKSDNPKSKTHIIHFL